MAQISVVIITKNEADVISKCIEAARLVSDDVIVMDNGSTDDTFSIAEAYGCRAYEVNWIGYGANKNEGIRLAKYDWILGLDADEVIDKSLIITLKNIAFSNQQTVYDIKYHSYFGGKRIKFGFWGRDHHVRLFNRNEVHWSESKVHETLVLPAGINIEKLAGHVNHFSVKDGNECRAKAIQYAKLSADDYFFKAKKASFFRLYLSPYFAFFMNYLFFLGILDGREGLEISKSIFKNKWLKYRLLKLKATGKIRPVSAHSVRGINGLSIRNG